MLLQVLLILDNLVLWTCNKCYIELKCNFVHLSPVKCSSEQCKILTGWVNTAGRAWEVRNEKCRLGSSLRPDLAPLFPCLLQKIHTGQTRQEANRQKNVLFLSTSACFPDMILFIVRLKIIFFLNLYIIIFWFLNFWL